ncbi:MAG: hypothetical protein A2W27_07110 [Deltaproteobacteria bacterium RBG_16_44_11]|nr:MAG: hypothetical protein A2W27_07110 [Deltaproteobacteria bacterium RBG_16_44_11]
MKQFIQNSWLCLAFICISLLFLSCSPPETATLPDLSRPARIPVTSRHVDVPLPGEKPFLWAIYTQANHIYLKETALDGLAVFRDDHSDIRHNLIESTSVLSRPSAALFKNSQWVAWKEGSTIYAKAIWWGPAEKRTVFTGSSAAPTAPAIVSYKGKLIVVWGEGDKLYFSRSDYGLDWTSPVSKTFEGFIVSTPAAAVHNSKLYVGVVLDLILYTVLIKDDMTWGPNYRAMELSETPLPEVSLASNNVRLSMGFSVESSIRVTHSSTGYNNWSAPREIETGYDYPAPPALRYFNNSLYAVYPTTGRLMMKRSPDGDNWETPRFVVEAEALCFLPAAAVIPSNYTVSPPTPAIHVVNNSGRPASSTFNVVFISEGYLESEMEEFRRVAATAADTFRASNPFSKHLNKFNIYRIDIPSREKGIKASPQMAAGIRQGIWDGERYQAAIPAFQARYTDTALGSRYFGEWESPHPGGRCVAEEPGHPHTRMTNQKAVFIYTDEMYSLVETLIPGFDRTRDILYAIVDQLPADGGTEKASFNPIVSTDDFALGLGNIHEIGHFMGGLTDEDFEDCWGGAADDCADSPNKTVNNNLHDPAHKWAHFFALEDRQGASVLADPLSRPPDRRNYWNPAQINASDIFNVGIWASLGVTDWSGTGGAIVYKPVAECLMNHTGGTTHFCPVCAEQMTKRLFARTGDTFSDAEYHERYDKVFVEYLHRDSVHWSSSWPKENFISINGSMVSVSHFRCYTIGKEGSYKELCSVEITPYIHDGTNRLIFHRQSGVTRDIDLMTIQVVNSNGAVLHLFPVTDVSSIGSADHFADYIWPTSRGDLTFEFASNTTPP